MEDDEARRARRKPTKVAALFAAQGDAEEAIRTLSQLGFRRDRMVVASRDERVRAALTRAEGLATTPDPVVDAVTRYDVDHIARLLEEEGHPRAQDEAMEFSDEYREDRILLSIDADDRVEDALQALSGLPGGPVKKMPH